VEQTTSAAPVEGATPAWRARLQGPEAFVVVALALIAGRPVLEPMLDGERIQTFFTVFISIVLQALPFLVLGVVVSGAITAFVPPATLTRALPRNAAAAVPVAGAAGMLLPGCECGSVPIAGRLIGQGVRPAAALTFLLSAPAINPVVLVSTAVAFPGQPEWVGARFAASLATAVVVGWIWAALGRDAWMKPPRRVHQEGHSRRRVFVDTAQHDFLHAGGYLVVGGLSAAVLNVLVPKGIIDTAAEQAVLSVLVLVALAIVMSICSEADAFVAASLTAFSPTSRLAFLVVGPMVDLKLIALQSGTFGGAFAARFAPLTVAVAVLASTAVAAVLL